MENTAVVILAAGKGKRMKSDLPKVLHKIFDQAMVEHLILTVISLSVNKIVVVVGYQAELVKKALSQYENQIDFVLQAKQYGTGHAVLVTENELADFEGDVLVMAGDVPFLSGKTIENLVAVHRRENAAATVLSAIPSDATGYGRIVRLPDSDLVDYIVEHKDATDEEKLIGEINSGTFCFSSRFLFEALREIKADNSQGEYYLTDIMKILRQKGYKAAVCRAENPDEVLGINSVDQLADLEARFAKKIG